MDRDYLPIVEQWIRNFIDTMDSSIKEGRARTGEDFGDMASFLLGEKNNWITGQIFHIDGGRSTLRIKA